jgi:transcription termination factor Rho
LRSRFLPERDLRYRRERAPLTRSARPEFRDLRRYREGRIWRGRDEILRLRENRERVGPNQGQGNGRQPPEGRGWWQRGERRAPQDGARERPAPQREDRGNRDNRDRGGSGSQGDKGSRDRGDKGNADRGDKGDHGGNRDQGDKGNRDRGDGGGGRDRPNGR